MYRGDFTPGKTIRVLFTTKTLANVPASLAGTPAISVYKDGGTTQSVAGVTLTVDFDSVTGLNLVVIDTSADGTFYSAASDFTLVITTGTVDSVSYVGTVVGSFSLSNRAALRPTVADRTLDVSAGGEAGLDWANIGSPTTTVALTGTTSKLVDASITSSTFASGAITATSIATDAIGSAEISAAAATKIGDATLAAVADGSLTLADSIKDQNAVLFGKSSRNTGTGVTTFRNPADSLDRVIITATGGVRTAVTRDNS